WRTMFWSKATRVSKMLSWTTEEGPPASSCGSRVGGSVGAPTVMVPFAAARPRNAAARRATRCRRRRPAAVDLRTSPIAAPSAPRLEALEDQRLHAQKRLVDGGARPLRVGRRQRLDERAVVLVRQLDQAGQRLPVAARAEDQLVDEGPDLGEDDVAGDAADGRVELHVEREVGVE